MDLITLYYYSELAKTLHFTRTAERLFISQQTLSNHIRRLEEEMGTQLFTRTPSLQLTYAGEQVLAFARKTLQDEEELKDILTDVIQRKRGRIRFGASQLRMDLFLPEILTEFGKQYPEVSLELRDQRSHMLESCIEEGTLDLAIAVCEETNPALGSKLLMKDPVYLSVADQLLRNYYPDTADAICARSRAGANLNDFAKLPFCRLDNRMGELIDSCFAEAGAVPYIFVSAPYIQIEAAIDMIGLAAGFVTGTSLFALQNMRKEKIHVFPLSLEKRPVTQHIYMIWRKDRYLPAYMRCFLELSEQYFQKIT